MRRVESPVAFRAYAAALAVLTLVFLPAGIREAMSSPLEAVMWIAFISAANLLAIPMMPKVNLDASLGVPVIVAAAVVLSPGFAVLVNFLAIAGERELKGQASFWPVVFNHSQIALGAGAASLTASLLAPGTILATITAVVVYNVVNIAAVTTSLFLLGRSRPAQAAKGSAAPFPRFAVDFGLVALLAVLIVIAYDSVGPWAVALLALPLWLGYSALRSARVAEDRAEQLADRVHDLEALNWLGAELLTARSSEHLEHTVAQALATVLGTSNVEVALDGQVREHLHVVRIQGAEPTAIGVPTDLPEESLAVVEAIAGLLSMAIQRLELERELSEMERARAALSGRILEEATRERNRIALEIHDEVLPYLAAGEIQADNVRSAIDAGAKEQADRLATATRDAIHDGMERLREVLEDLRRQILVPGGLRPGLSDALEELQLHHAIDTRLTAPEPLPPLPLAVEILVLETVRGCITNVVRHADARSLALAVDVTDGIVSVTMSDDGCGFDPTAVPAGHHGMALMAQRVELARGRFMVTSAPGEGTTVQVEVPV